MSNAELTIARHAAAVHSAINSAVAAPSAERIAIEPAPALRHQPFPLTDIQQAYWIGRRSAFQLGNIAAHGYMEVDADGVDLDRLDAALQQVIARHDMLRAVVGEDGMQRILPEVPSYRLQRIDLRAADAEACERQLAEVRGELSHQVLDPAQWPLFDFRVSQLPENRVRLHISIDVLIFDAQSFDIISDDWKRYYQDPSLMLPALEFSYADYVRGLGFMADSAQAKQSAAYWRQRLDDLPNAPELPMAVNPATITRPRFRRRTGRLDRAAWGRFKQRAATLGLTPSVALLSAYARVLGRWSMQPRFTLNLTLFNRVPFHSEVDGLVGDFTSVIPLAIDTGRGRSFIDDARAVQNELWESMDHRHVSGVWIMRELNERRRRTTLLPVVFTSTLKNAATDATHDRAMSWLGAPGFVLTQTPQVWLDQQIEEDADGLLFDWDAVEELFPTGMLDDMFESYRGLIEALADDDAAWRGSCSVALPQWQRALYADTNSTAAPVPCGLLHTPVLAQCARTPERAAVIVDERVHSYGELHLHSNRIAHHLWEIGADTGERIGVYLPKGFEQIAAVIGILEAGGVYVPMDPAQPPDRLADIVEAGGIRRVLCTGAIAAARPLTGVEMVMLDALAQQPHAIAALPETVRPDELAYVIFTSGSTGQPKGVAIDHRGARNTLVDVNQRFDIGADDRVLGLSELNFDLSVYDIFGLLAIGAALVLPSPERQREPAHWDALMRTHRVTVWNTVPALMDIYTSYLDTVAHRCDETLRVVMMSGDWIPVRLPAAIRKVVPNARLYSMGGATEASIWSIGYPIDTVDPTWRSIPYGKPMLNQRFHVLDERLDPRPVWSTGELYIGGIGLAHGYLGDEMRSAASFFRHPRSGERLYRTGDLGRYLPDGNIEFLGRRDFQAKINGYRVELGEIESVLERGAGVQAAVVTLHGDHDRAKKLVGYYVRSKDEADAKAAAKLRHRLSDPGIRRIHADVPRIALPEGSRRAPEMRRTTRHFRREPVALSALNEFLQVLRRHDTEHGKRYHYGSAGSLYPVQAYLSIREGGVEGIDAGLYYYHPVDNALVRVGTGTGAGLDASYVDQYNAEMWDDCGFQLFLVANLDAIDFIYGTSSSQMVLLEAGLMTQLLEDAAAVIDDFGVCQIGGFDFARAEPVFDFPHRPHYLHCIVGGLPAPVPAAPAVPAEVPVAVSFEDRLRAHLAAKLPGYMVPSVLVELDALPLSANGKVDRSALPDPKQQRTAPPRRADAAQSSLATDIRAAWADVLGNDSIGLDDGFFDLGGTSVDMIKIHSRLQGRLPQPVAVVDMFFTYPTIGALVEHIERNGAAVIEMQPPNQAADRNRRAAAQRMRRKGA